MAAAAHKQNEQDVISWCDEIYTATFSEYFDTERKLYKRLKDSARPITDSELENILTTLPLQLFAASEALSQLKIRSEVVKLDIKDKLYQQEKVSPGSTVTARKEDAAYSVLADQLLQVAYTNIIDRVEKEISYSREVIMAAKKIWDSRRNTEQVAPTTLPDYKSTTATKAYIQ